MNRKITSSINWILDNILPPLLRDSKPFMYILMFPLFKNKTNYFLTFKDDPDISNEEHLLKYYELLDDAHIERDTDLNEKSIEYIIDNIVGQNVLDIACGTGHLVREIALLYPNKTITGIDFNLSSDTDKGINNFSLHAGSILKIAYEDNHFDTVISAHTLEHLYNPQEGLKELRRVAKKRLIIVLPKQREYKYTFDLHLHFYPYKYSLYSRLGINKNALVLILDNDYLIVEDY